MNWLCRPRRCAQGAHPQPEPPVRCQAGVWPFSSPRLGCPLGTGPHMHRPSHARAPACTGLRMSQSSTADLVRWRCFLADGLTTVSAGAALAAWRGVDSLECAWMRSAMGLEAPVQTCIPNFARYTYSSCSRIILKRCRPITILKTAQNSPF